MTNKIKSWSTTPGNNISAPPAGWPEGMAPSMVNNTARQDRASVREWYEDAEWINFGHVIFTVAGQQITFTGDVQVNYRAKQAIRQNGIDIGLITAVLLVGGNTRITVAGFVPAAVPTSIEIASTYNSVARLASGNSKVEFSTYEGDVQVSAANVLIGAFTPDGLDMSKALNTADAGSVASASTVDLRSIGDLVQITGTTNIATIQIPAGAIRRLIFAGSLTMTQNATLLLPGPNNITTQANDVATFLGLSGSRSILISYARAANPTAGSTGVVIAAGSFSASTTIIPVLALAWKTLRLEIEDLEAASDYCVGMQLNGLATSIYDYSGVSTDQSNTSRDSKTGGTSHILSRASTNSVLSNVSGNVFASQVWLKSPSSAKQKRILSRSVFNSASDGMTHVSSGGGVSLTAAVSSIGILMTASVSGGNLSGAPVTPTGGTYRLIGELGTI